MYNELDRFIELTRGLLKDEEQNPVAKPLAPETMDTMLDLSLTEEGLSSEAMSQVLERLIRATPKTSSKKFFNQLFGGRHPASVLGDLLSVILNNSMYTYKVAGPQIGVEQVIIREIARRIGYPDGAEGIFAPGGSLANFMALLLARDRANNQIVNRGIQGSLVGFTSEHAHYSNFKNASFAGIGRDHIRVLPCDGNGRLIPEALETAIIREQEAGHQPFFVNITAGTTVLGAFDPIRPVAEICMKYGLWLHVDGAYCGAVFLSRKHRHFLDGLELADSFSFNAHKMLVSPLTCSIFLTQKRNDMLFSFGSEADYLYQTDADIYNPGKISLQCGRRNDALKLWTLWKAVGSRGLEEMIDRQFELAAHARNYLRENPHYELIADFESVSVCFNYRGVDPKRLCTLLYAEAELMVGYGSFAGREFVRMVTVNAMNTAAEIDAFFQTIESFVDSHPELKS